VDKYVQLNGLNVQNIVHLCAMENELEDKKSRIRIRATVTEAEAIRLGVFCKINAVLGVTLRIISAYDIAGYADVEFNFRSTTRQNFYQTIIAFFLAYSEFCVIQSNKKP
jgi:hypothetical protein